MRAARREVGGLGPATAADGDQRVAGLEVLVVDDDQGGCDPLQEALRHLDFATRAYADGRETCARRPSDPLAWCHWMSACPGWMGSYYWCGCTPYRRRRCSR